MKTLSKKSVIVLAMTSIAMLSTGAVASASAGEMTVTGRAINNQKILIEKDSTMQNQSTSMALAQRELKAFITNSAKATLAEIPFSLDKVSDLKQASVAYGFEMHTINPNDIIDGRQELKNVVQGSGIWRFMIKVGQTPVGLMTIENIGGKWQATEFGASGLAKDLDEQMSMYGDAKRSNMRFVRVYQAQADFIEVSKPAQGTVQFAPLNSARLSLHLPKKQAEQAVASTSGKGMVLNKSASSELLEGRDLLDPLRAAVKRSMSNEY